MDERRARIYDDLRGVVGGTSISSPWIGRRTRTTQVCTRSIPWEWSSPATKTTSVNVVRYAAENRIPLHVRGAGTDTGGGSLGPGLVVDLSRHLRKIIAIGPEHVVVEPGVVLDVLECATGAAGAPAGAGPER